MGYGFGSPNHARCLRTLRAAASCFAAKFRPAPACTPRAPSHDFKSIRFEHAEGLATSDKHLHASVLWHGTGGARRALGRVQSNGFGVRG